MQDELICCAELQQARGRVQTLRAELERSQVRIDELETDHRSSRKRIQQLEQQVAALVGCRALIILPGYHPRRASGLVGVPWIQAALRALVDPRLEVDGIVGPATRTAVRAFQAAHGLANDGRVVGEQTRAALQRELQTRGLGDDS